MLRPRGGSTATARPSLQWYPEARRDVACGRAGPFSVPLCPAPRQNSAHPNPQRLAATALPVRPDARYTRATLVASRLG